MTRAAAQQATNPHQATATLDPVEVEQLRLHLARARKLEAVGKLAGAMAHEFNNLVGVIIGNLDLLAEQQGLGTDARNITDEALQAALRAAEIADRLLTLARRQPLQPTMVLPNEIIGRLIEGEGQQAAVELDLAEDAWSVMADPVALEGAISVLLRQVGAAPGTPATIATSHRHLDAAYVTRHLGVAAGDYLLIEVSGAATAVESNAAERAADPLEAPGPGPAALELASVFGFAAESGGHFDVFTEAGTGATFRLYLPRIAFDPPESDPAPGPETGGHETILAVDDNPGQRRLVARQLRELGYRTLEAEDGPSALMILNTEPVDLLFTDVVMPGGMSGYDLARLTLSRWPRMKALLTTAYPEARLTGEQLPPNKLRQLAKPYRKAELAQTLREILDA